MKPAPRHALAFIAVTLLLDTVGLGLIMPVQPALLVELTGESVSRVATYGGWLAFVYAIMQFICAPILGNLSDRFGRRPVLLFAVGSGELLSRRSERSERVSGSRAPNQQLEPPSNPRSR